VRVDDSHNLPQVAAGLDEQSANSAAETRSESEASFIGSVLARFQIFLKLTRHKYIIIGTKVLGQIVSEPIEEGQHIKVGDILARIDDRDYQAQLRQASAARELSETN
jgi:multidrug efflux pump subunit AcrA (membrane-fusion protein)